MLDPPWWDPDILSPMIRSILVGTLCVGALSLSARTAEAQAARPISPSGKHCVDEARSKAYIKETLIGQLNPYGGEHRLELVLCKPLIETPGVLFDYTNAQIGLTNYLSPTYVFQGGFVSVSPLSPLELRAELNGVYVWAFPLDGAGYYGLNSYTDDAHDKARKKENAGQAAGMMFVGSATLRVPVVSTKRFTLLLVNTFAAELWHLGEAPYNYNNRRDLTLARTDWLLKNTAAVLAEIKVSDNIAIRVGPTDDLSYIPAGHITANLAAGLVTFLVRKVSRTVRNFQPFVRVGGYTSHPTRDGELNVVAGIDATYELFPGP
jgi:hypothetical protein